MSKFYLLWPGTALSLSGKSGHFCTERFALKTLDCKISWFDDFFNKSIAGKNLMVGTITTFRLPLTIIFKFLKMLSWAVAWASRVAKTVKLESCRRNVEPASKNFLSQKYAKGFKVQNLVNLLMQFDWYIHWIKFNKFLP